MRRAFPGRCLRDRECADRRWLSPRPGVGLLQNAEAAASPLRRPAWLDEPARREDPLGALGSAPWELRLRRRPSAWVERLRSVRYRIACVRAAVLPHRVGGPR